MHIEYPSRVSVSDLMKRLKWRTSRNHQREFPVLKKRYWGRHFWAIGYGVWSTGNVTDEMGQEYLEHHRHPSNKETGSIVIEWGRGLSSRKRIMYLNKKLPAFK
tara:strand:+ start:417 stop:728 length:312 start_codon:yes stop_codon:yes gene_type:complete